MTVRMDEGTPGYLGRRKIPMACYAGMMFAAPWCAPRAGRCFELLVILWKPLNDEKKMLCDGPSMMPKASYLRNADELA